MANSNEDIGKKRINDRKELNTLAERFFRLKNETLPAAQATLSRNVETLEEIKVNLNIAKKQLLEKQSKSKPKKTNSHIKKYSEVEAKQLEAGVKKYENEIKKNEETIISLNKQINETTQAMAESRDAMKKWMGGVGNEIEEARQQIMSKLFSERPLPASDNEKYKEILDNLDLNESILMRAEKNLKKVEDAERSPKVDKQIYADLTASVIEDLNELDTSIDFLNRKMSVLEDLRQPPDFTQDLNQENVAYDEEDLQGFDKEESQADEEARLHAIEEHKKALIERQLKYDIELDVVLSLPSNNQQNINNKVNKLIEFLQIIQNDEAFPDVLKKDIQNLYMKLNKIENAENEQQVENRIAGIAEEIRVNFLPYARNLDETNEIKMHARPILADDDPKLVAEFKERKEKLAKLLEDAPKNEENKISPTEKESAKKTESINPTVVAEPKKDNLAASKAAAQKDQSAPNLPVLGSKADHQKDIQKLTDKLDKILAQKAANKEKINPSAPTIRAKS